jgi:hypothetical protein
MYRSVLVSFILTLAGPARADLVNELESAADHHVAAQGDYKGGLKNSWEYKIGTRRSAVNITGVTAAGLLAAFRLTSLQEHQDAALRAARSLVEAYDLGWKKHRPFTQDIEFLAEAGFIIDAGRWFNVTCSYYAPEPFVDLIMSGRGNTPAIAGWDLASAIRAAIAVGQIAYARGLVTATIKRRSEWDRGDKGLGQWLARGSMLWALAKARDRVGLTPEQRRVAESLAAELSAAQRREGGWQEGPGGVYCTQTTAYAVLGLSQWSAGKSAAKAGRTWLRRVGRNDSKFFVGGKIWATTYLLNGRPENDYNSEIQSEAMLALAGAR